MIIQIMIIVMGRMTKMTKMMMPIENVDQVGWQELTGALIGDWRQQCTRALTHAP